MAYIPKTLYVGFRADGQDTLTCFMTPKANDAAFAKRKKTIDDWSSKEMSSTEISNEPRKGFRLVDTSRRWNSNNVVFRVIHPEIGAEFEISAENLNNIMSNTDILKGEIQDKLLLIREGSKNILVIENSPEHKGSSEVDDNGKELFLKKDEYNIGDSVSIKGTGDVIYFGKNKVHELDLNVSTRYNNGYQPSGLSVKIDDECHEGFVCYDISNEKVHVFKTAPKVLKNYGASNQTIDCVIGKSYSYNSLIYDVGDKKDNSLYEYKTILTNNTYGSCLILNGSSYELVHRSYNQYASYGTVDLTPDGKILQINTSYTGTYASAKGKVFYRVTKVLK